jgi:hypothetical protein
MHRARFLIGFALIVAVVAVIQHARHVRPTVPKVAAAALRAPETHAIPAGMPDFSARRWRPVGGRTDEIGGRTVVSATYRRGGATVTYSRMADTKGLNDGTGTWTTSWGDKRWLAWQQTQYQLMARSVRGGHQVVLTAVPATKALRRELTRLATIARVGR